MTTKTLLMRSAIGAVGGVLLLGTAGRAIADESEGSEDVDINVQIDALPPTGALTLSVARGSETLTEVDSGDPDLREFVGTLPTVTVTDDRTEVPEGAYWYVTGQSADFTAPGVDEAIPATQLGWTPQLLSDDSDGWVDAGDEVVTVLDEPTAGGPGGGQNNVGLASGEDLLVWAIDSAEAHALNGSWEANAELFLKTETSVTPGGYSAALTLTLWEDES